MKKVWAWLLVLVVASRLLSYLFLRGDPTYVFIPRSFLGGGLQIQPALLDLVTPAIVIFCLWPGRILDRKAVRPWGTAAWDALSLLLFPLFAGLSLFAYEGPWHISSDRTITAVLRWLQFLGAFVACNMLLDEVSAKRRWQRVVIATTLVITLGPLQDTYPNIRDPFPVLLSVGTTLMWAVLALRRRYCQSPLAAISAAALTGAASCLLIVMAPSDSLFAGLLPMLALPLGALTIRSERAWPRWAALASVAGLGLFLSLVVPHLVPTAERAHFLTQEPPPSHAEEVEGITVRYEDIRVRQAAMQLAHVLAAANRVSLDAYGISPQVNELVIRGFEEGGFQAEFPHKISGNFASQHYVDLCLDSSFLSEPNGSIHFPDPVNAILHEFSHLYGAVPYQPWVRGPEEEGWATFSATRLSRRLYERFGPGLWNPPYDYGTRADLITRSNLAGHPVYWSHPDEYGGFRLWYLLAQKNGETALYRKRWALTARKSLSWWLQINDPGAARQLAKTMGLADFVSFGSGRAVRYGQVYSLQDVRRAEEMLGGPAGRASTNYAARANRLVDPTVRVPALKPLFLDLALSLIFLVPSVIIKRLHPVWSLAESSVAPVHK